MSNDGLEEILDEWLARLRLGRDWQRRAEQFAESGLAGGLALAQASEAAAGERPSEQDLRLLLLGRADRPQQRAGVNQRFVGLDRPGFNRQVPGQRGGGLGSWREESGGAAAQLAELGAPVDLAKKAEVDKTPKLPAAELAGAVAMNKVAVERNVIADKELAAISESNELARAKNVKIAAAAKEIKALAGAAEAEPKNAEDWIAAERSLGADGGPAVWPVIEPGLAQLNAAPDLVWQSAAAEAENLAPPVDWPVLAPVQVRETVDWPETEEQDVDRLADLVAEKLRNDLEAVLGSSSLV